MNPHSIAAKHRDPKPELRPSFSRTIPPEEGPIHVTSRQPSAHPQALCRPSVPPGTSWGDCDSDQGPVSALRSKQQRGRAPCSRPARLPRAAADDHLSGPGLCPGFLGKRGRAPLTPVRECGPPSCGEDLDCARRERPGPPLPTPPVPRRPGVGSPALDPRPWGTPAQSHAAGRLSLPPPRASLFTKLSSLTAGFKGPSLPLLILHGSLSADSTSIYGALTRVIRGGHSPGAGLLGRPPHPPPPPQQLPPQPRAGPCASSPPLLGSQGSLQLQG